LRIWKKFEIQLEIHNKEFDDVIIHINKLQEKVKEIAASLDNTTENVNSK
jgi:hypothetical protein